MNLVYLQYTKLMNSPVTRKKDEVSISLDQFKLLNRQNSVCVCGFKTRIFKCSLYLAKTESIISLLPTMFPFILSLFSLYSSNCSSHTNQSLTDYGTR